MNRLEFELGDCVYCPYYKVKGIIVNINKRYITIRYDNNECVTKITTKSANAVLPFYLQMICKKSNIENIANEVLGL